LSPTVSNYSVNSFDTQSQFMGVITMKNSKVNGKSSVSNTITKSAHTYAFPQAAWERQLQRELQDPNRFYEGSYGDMDESFGGSIKAVRLG
jgi:hypothetical protein